VIFRTRRSGLAVAAAVPLLSVLAGCGSLNATGSGDAGPGKGDDITVGLLLPEKANTRYDKFDHPIIASKVASLTGGQGRVEYANAEADADRQAGQLQDMIDAKVDVILLDAVDAHAVADGVTRAKEANIPVIAYDRLAEGPVDGYVSFDNELVGEVQGRSLIEALGTGMSISDQVVMINGSATDPNAKQYKAGALAQLTGKVTVAAQYDTEGWKPENAVAHMKEAIAEIGADDIAAVYAANDGMAGAVVQSLKAAGVTELPPITGQDAELDAVRRILTGEQYMSVYKSYPQEAEAAAEMAVARVQGKNLQFDALAADRVDSPTHSDIPALLVSVVALTKDTVRETVLAENIYRLEEICAGEVRSACEAAKLK
jgi:D-xylose transport system substrate-binding protein